MTKIPVDERKLNSEQKAAVEFGDGPLLIIAGAGTGKTTVITERIKHLISSGRSKQSEILALTFTEKAAREMEERVDTIMPYGYTEMWISTFHKFCDRVLRQEAIHIGLSPAYKLMTDADATMILRKNLFSFGLDYFRPLGNPMKFIGGMLTHFDRLRDEDVSPEQYSKWAKKKPDPNQELARAYKAYQDIKAKEGLMDFADLIGYTLKLFRTRQNILRQYQEQFTYLLVDEFQDTNIAQNELLLLLTGKTKNITAVADDDQSIYKFRGAAVSNVISFRKHFSKVKIIVLSKNYRSTQTILDTSYRLIEHNNPDRLEVKEGINKKLVSARSMQGERVVFIHADRVENEADMVAKEIKKLKGSDPYSLKDFAILVRANNHAEPFVRALARQGIPYQFLGPGQLFRQPEIKDLIAYLSILNNFDDNVSLLRVLSMNYFDLSGRDIAAISNFSKKYSLSLFEACEVVTGKRTLTNSRLPFTSDKTREVLEKIVSMIHRHLGLLTKETAGQILFYFLQDCGMMKRILEYTMPFDERKANNIMKFFNKLKSYEAEHEDASVSAVLDWIMLSMELGESPLANDTDWTDVDAVNILTVHSAKGLEFRVVFLVNLVSQRFPTTERREQIPLPDVLIKEILPEGDYHLEEERRLFYVGMTRARDRLILTAADYYGEGKREKKISPFVYEALGNSATSVATVQKQLFLLDWQKVEKKTIDKQINMKIDYLSYSQIEAFLLCPLHYKLRHILGIVPAPSAALSFGISMHSTLKEFYFLKKSGLEVNKKLLVELLEKNWMREGYTSKRHEQEMRKRGEKNLQEYFEISFDPNITPVLLEQPFTIPITASGRTLKIGGKIDRVDSLSGSKIEIIDYKTGRVPSKREMDTSLQLSIYAIAATDIPTHPFHKNAEEVVLSLYYFDTQEKISTTRTREQLEDEKERIVTIAKEIEASDFRCSGNQLCTTCEYKMFCGVSGQ